MASQAIPCPPAAITPEEVEEAVMVFWPRFDTHEIASIYGWHESHIANALARLKREERIGDCRE